MRKLTTMRRTRAIRFQWAVSGRQWTERRASGGEIFLDQAGPAFLRLENHFDRLADGRIAAGVFCDVLRSAAKFFAGVGHGHAQSDRSNWRQVRQVVADVAHLLQSQAELAGD